MSKQDAIARYPTQAPIDAYGDGGFRFAGMSHVGSLLCLSSGIYAWGAADVADISMESLKPVIDEAATTEVLLIGTGSTQTFLAPALLSDLKATGMIIETMATGAAARTYNVLLGEQRRVAAALIAVGEPAAARSTRGGGKHE